MPVSRFAPLAGVPERTYRRRLARLRQGAPVKGPWPTPQVDAIEAVAAKYASAWPAWGHRKIAMMRADGIAVSTSTVERALRRRGLLLPVGFRADRKSWAVLRRRVFRDPPTERSRVWQTDFSEFETTASTPVAGCPRTAATSTTTSRSTPSPTSVLRATPTSDTCRPHHRLKGLRGWKVHQYEDGSIVWITPTGHEYLVEPPPLTEPRVPVTTDDGPPPF